MIGQLLQKNILDGSLKSQIRCFSFGLPEDVCPHGFEIIKPWMKGGHWHPPPPGSSFELFHTSKHSWDVAIRNSSCRIQTYENGWICIYIDIYHSLWCMRLPICSFASPYSWNWLSNRTQAQQAPQRDFFLHVSPRKIPFDFPTQLGSVMYDLVLIPITQKQVTLLQWLGP